MARHKNKGIQVVWQKDCNIAGIDFIKNMNRHEGKFFWVAFKKDHWISKIKYTAATKGYVCEHTHEATTSDRKVIEHFAKILNTPGPICKHCGCITEDCNQCIERIGIPCSWVVLDGKQSICSACKEVN